MRAAIPKIHTVVVTLKLSGATGRDLLNGISTYAKEHCHWRLRIFSRSEDFTPAALREIPDVDGIITSEPGAEGIPDLLESDDTPLVVIGMKGIWLKRRTRRLTFVRSDDEDIGRFAARNLLSLGKFRSFGFVPSAGRTYWSLLREKGYRAFLRKQSVPVSVYRGDVPLRKWLEALPKPTALFAAFDERAVNVLAACNEAGLRVPEHVAVIGVDNDELLCDFCDPPLSSVLPDRVREGRTVARELDRLLRRAKTPPGHSVLCTAKRLIVRESTAPIAPATHLINEVLRYVQSNATSDLRVADVVRHLGVSRRLVDRRLHELNEPPLAKLISNVRLNEVARRLRKTDLPIGQIADACSFGNLQHLANAFKRHFGQTMTEFRVGGLTPSDRTGSGRGRDSSGRRADP